MPREARGKDVAPTVRGAFIRAVKALEDKGKPLSEIIQKELDERPLETLRAIASFVPKELMLQGDSEAPMHLQVSVEFVSSDPESV